MLDPITSSWLTFECSWRYWWTNGDNEFNDEQQSEAINFIVASRPKCTTDARALKYTKAVQDSKAMREKRK